MQLSLTTIKVSIARFLHRYHIILFTVVTLGGMAYVVFLLNSILITSADTSNYISPTSNTTFDTKTIDQLNKLSSDKTLPPLVFPKDTRTNPFVE